MFLMENKRMKTKEQKYKLKNFKKDIFNKSIPIIDTITKYFEFTSDLTQSLNNIAYMNSTCKLVSSHIRKKLNKKNEYELGEYLICREYTKLKDGTLNVNFQFKIT